MNIMTPLESAAFDCLYDQLAGHKITAATHYAVDLAMDILKDPLIATTSLDLKKYIFIIGQDAWKNLLAEHAHTPNVANV